MPGGAPKGNKNAVKDNRLWGDAVRRAVMQRKGQKLRQLADKLVDLAQEGDIQALKELGDRLDGRAAQSIGIDQEANIIKVIHEAL